MNNPTHHTQTPHFITAILTLAAVLLVMSSTAAAQGAQPSKPDLKAPKNTAVDLHVSIGGANGWVGLGLNHTLSQDFALEVGGGLGFTGPAVTLTPHWLIINKTSSTGNNHRLSLGMGLSSVVCVFTRTTGFILDERHYDADMTVWFNGELRYTYQHRGGFRIGTYAGTTRLLYTHNAVTFSKDNDGKRIDVSPISTSEYADSGTFYPTVGVFTGYAF